LTVQSPGSLSVDRHPGELTIGDENNAAGGVNLRYIYRLVRAHLALATSIIVGVLILAVLVSVLQAPRYTGIAKIQISNASSPVFKKGEDDQDTDASNQTDTERFLQTQVDIIKSRGLAERVAQSLKLFHDPRFYASQGLKPPKPGASEDAVRDRTVGILLKNLEVSLPRASRIVSLSYESTDRKMSADIANAYVNEFVQSNLQRKFDSSGYARDFLSHQLLEVKQKLQTSEEALNAYTRRVGLIRPQTATVVGTQTGDQQNNTSVTTASLMQLNQAANEAKARRIAAETRWETINSGTNSSEILTNAAVTALLGQRAALASALQEERARHLDTYPTVVSKQAQLATIDKQIALVIKDLRNSVHAEYLSAVSAERDLNRQVMELKADTLNEQDRNVQYSFLAREVQTNRELYEGLLERYKTLNASAGISLSNIAVIDSAETPISPTSPNIPKNLAIGLVVGVVLAAIVLAIKDQFDDTVRIPEDIAGKLHLNLLGVIPKTDKSVSMLDLLSDSKSMLTEAYNSLRGSLLFSTTQGLPKRLLVLSAQASEGKSITSFATAVTLSRIGRKVLLIDADLRRPTQHKMVNAPNNAGLSSLLTSFDSLTSVAIVTDYPNLTIIPSGPIPPNPTELLSSGRMKEVLTEADGLFDVVLVDSAPVLGLADAPTLSAIVDGVLFVVEADRGRYGALKTALSRLRMANPRILGGLLTKFDTRRGGGRYSSYYGYEYYQYHNDEE
jgi:polysaccharide biosynthesis transport protein